MFTANSNNANALNTHLTDFPHRNQPSPLGFNNDNTVLSTENLYPGTPSSSDTSLPDLIIENPGGFERAIAGEKVTLSYSEKNIGNGNAGRHFVGFYLSKDDKFDGSDRLLGNNSFNRVDSLAAGGSISLSKEFTLDKNIESGDYYVLYVADDFSSVTESNESNNVVARQISIQGTSPDLIIKNADAPDTAKAGSKINLYYREENIGKRKAGEHKVGFYLSTDNQWDSQDTRLGDDVVSGLDANGGLISRTKEFTLGENLAPGDYYILYVSDDGKNLNESDITNNVFARKITIECEQAYSSNLRSFNDTPIDSNPSALADLIVEVDNDTSPERAKAGSEITLSYTEKNAGSLDAGEHRVGFYLSKDDKFDETDTFLASDSLKSVSSGKYISHTTTFTLNDKIETGDYYLLYVGDDNKLINESNEDNNVVAKAISIQGKEV